jgi:hypothetical protein
LAFAKLGRMISAPTFSLYVGANLNVVATRGRPQRRGLAVDANLNVVATRGRPQRRGLPVDARSTWHPSHVERRGEYLKPAQPRTNAQVERAPASKQESRI